MTEKLEQIEGEAFEKWCPIKILDPAKAPKATIVKEAMRTGWLARARSEEEVRECLGKSVDLFASFVRNLAGIPVDRSDRNSIIDGASKVAKFSNDYISAADLITRRAARLLGREPEGSN